MSKILIIKDNFIIFNNRTFQKYIINESTLGQEKTNLTIKLLQKYARGTIRLGTLYDKVICSFFSQTVIKS